MSEFGWQVCESEDSVYMRMTARGDFNKPLRKIMREYLWHASM